MPQRLCSCSLIEIETGLVTVQKIDLEVHAFDFDRRFARESVPRKTPYAVPIPRLVRTGASFRSTMRDAAEQIDDCSRDQILSHVHRQRERLQNEMIAVAVDDHARKTVAFAPHNPTQLWIDISSVTVFGSLHDAASKEIEIQILPSPRETARNDL